MGDSEVGISISSGVVGTILGAVGMFLRAKYAADRPDFTTKPFDSERCHAAHASLEANQTLLFQRVGTLEQKAACTEGKLELIISGQEKTNDKLDRLLERRAD